MEIQGVRIAIRELVRRLNERDESVCTELFTSRHVKFVTGLRGVAGVKQCQADVRDSRARIRLIKIEGVRVVGRLSLCQFLSSSGRGSRRQILRLVDIGGRWKIDGDGSRGL